jgi:type VI protein secretion system component VasK
VFHELREYAQRQAECAESAWRRKLFYLLTCHYCFSHYVTAFFIAITGYKLLKPNWTGYVIALFALVWVANIYMSVYAWLRQQYKMQKFEAKAVEHEVKQKMEPSRIEFPPAA